jgi:hypothetical protein
MTGDDIGLNFFTQHSSPTPSSKASAFGPVDQDAMIARIDTVEEDDLSSTFFGDSLLDVERASTRAFDIGIRVHGTTPDAAAPRGAAMTTAGIDDSPAPAADPVEVPVVGGLADDDRSRAAFILGGPAGLQ